MKGTRTFATAIVAGLTAIAATTAARAEPTDITVRVISKGAKFVGTSMGGVRVTVADRRTGEILADGVTQGGTGDTGRIMVEPRQPGAPLSTEGAAKFTATIDIEEPRLIEVTAHGPLAQSQAANTVAATQWVVPGKHITGGDGWVLELPGLVVDVLAPPTPVALGAAPKTVELRAHVVTMCGCPVEPGGLWDANEFEVRALLRRDGEPAGEIPLDYAGTASQFAATWRAEQPGVYEAIVYAHQPSNGNTGLDRATFIVTE